MWQGPQGSPPPTFRKSSTLAPSKGERAANNEAEANLLLAEAARQWWLETGI